MTTYTHTARRMQTGYYAVTSEAVRKPGKRHAANQKPGHTDAYVALCGEQVHAESSDCFVQDNEIEPAGKYRVTCKRCLRKIG